MDDTLRFFSVSERYHPPKTVGPKHVRQTPETWWCSNQIWVCSMFFFGFSREKSIKQHFSMIFLRLSMIFHFFFGFSWDLPWFSRNFPLFQGSEASELAHLDIGHPPGDPASWLWRSDETIVIFNDFYTIYQWIGFPENLQETMVFTITYRSFL